MATKRKTTATKKSATRKSATKDAVMKTSKSAATKASAKTSKGSVSEASSKSSVQRFRVPLEKDETSEACGITIPFDVQQTFGTRARVPVRGTINGFPFRSSIFPMGGCFMMAVNRGMREGAGVKAGEIISVTMERDTEPRVITPPADFARALKANKDAKALWDKLSYTHQREHVRAIEEAKRPETRQRRIEKAVEQLAAGQKPL